MVFRMWSTDFHVNFIISNTDAIGFFYIILARYNKRWAFFYNCRGNITPERGLITLYMTAH